MKVGLLTFFIGQNYGAQLQAWALERVLEQQGHQVELIHFYHPWSLTPYWWSWRSYVARTPAALWERLRKMRHHLKLRHVFSKMEALFPTTKVRYGTDARRLEACPPRCDAYVVGSDQVWNMNLKIWDPCRPYLLPFGSADIKRIAYGASLGGSRFEGVEDKVDHLLRRFSAISVREENGRRTIRSISSVNVDLVPDPTIALGRSGFDEFRKLSPAMPDGKDVFYILGRVSAEMLAMLRKLVCNDSYSIALQDFRIGQDYDHIPETPQFVDVIARSKRVITNSFHGTAMAVLFHKPFVCILFDDETKNERVKQLLSSVGIEGHTVSSTFRGHIYDIINENVNWDLVDENLKRLSEFGRDWLKMALK